MGNGREAGRSTGRPITWRPACQASSSPATPAPSRPSASPRPGERARWPCCEGRVVVAEPGPVYAEGDPARLLYVLLSGTLMMSRRIGDDDVEVTRTSAPGVYAGAFIAYLGDRVPQVYNNSLAALERSRFFVLDAAKFAQLMTDWFPMAVHLLEGLFFGARNAQEAIGQRERRLALGSLSAGLTHELNNPAAAAVR